MLNAFAPDIWIADGEIVSVLGFCYPTRCAVIRLDGDSLLIWSPVTLTPKLQSDIARLGKITHIIAPNDFHHLFIAPWQAAFPEAQLYGTKRLHEKRSDLVFAGILGETPDPAWAKQIDQIVIRHKLLTEVVFFHKASCTVIFTDLIQQFDDDWHTGLRKTIAKLDLMVGAAPSVPRKFRFSFGNKPQARDVINRILQWPIERVLLAHGRPVTSDGNAIIARAFSWLLK